MNFYTDELENAVRERRRRVGTDVQQQLELAAALDAVRRTFLWINKNGMQFHMWCPVRCLPFLPRVALLVAGQSMNVVAFRISTLEAPAVTLSDAKRNVKCCSSLFLLQ